MQVNTYQDSIELSYIIRSVQALRTKLFTHHYDLAVTFAIDAARGWRLQGVYGMEVACWVAFYQLEKIAGGYDCYKMARDTADMCERYGQRNGQCYQKIATCSAREKL